MIDHYAGDEPVGQALGNISPVLSAICAPHHTSLPRACVDHIRVRICHCDCGKLIRVSFGQVSVAAWRDPSRRVIWVQLVATDAADPESIRADIELAFFSSGEERVNQSLAITLESKCDVGLRRSLMNYRYWSGRSCGKHPFRAGQANRAASSI